MQLPCHCSSSAWTIRLWSAEGQTWQQSISHYSLQVNIWIHTCNDYTVWCRMPNMQLYWWTYWTCSQSLQDFVIGETNAKSRKLQSSKLLHMTCHVTNLRPKTHPFDSSASSTAERFYLPTNIEKQFCAIAVSSIQVVFRKKKNLQQKSSNFDCNNRKINFAKFCMDCVVQCGGLYLTTHTHLTQNL